MNQCLRCFFVVIILVSCSFSLTSQHLALYQNGSSRQEGFSNINLGYNLLRLSAEGATVTVDKILNFGFDYSINDQIDLKVDYQRGFDTEANSIIAAPKFSFDKLGFTPGIGYAFGDSYGELFTNTSLLYEINIRDNATTSLGANYTAFFNNFSEGQFGFLISGQADFDQIVLSSVIYFSPDKENDIQFWMINYGVQLSYVLNSGQNSSSSKSGTKSSIWDY